MRNLFVSAFLVIAGFLSAAEPVSAQAILPGAGSPQRNCQTVRTCRFERGGTYRGCLSSYTCRVCRTVKARCQIGEQSQNCHRVVCSWGG